MITQIKSLFRTSPLVTVFIFTFLYGFSYTSSAQDNANSRSQSQQCYVLVADRVFDGFNLLENAAVLIKNNKVIQTGDAIQLGKQCSRAIDLGDATILPGFIESHAHLTFQN
ncbi:MAG TPA: amidohydrolase, partial [Nitrosomonas sp.]|nr:amidohydrolase [Nitrosomonas sp.]